MGYRIHTAKQLTLDVPRHSGNLSPSHKRSRTLTRGTNGHATQRCRCEAEKTSLAGYNHSGNTGAVACPHTTVPAIDKVLTAPLSIGIIMRVGQFLSRF